MVALLALAAVVGGIVTSLLAVPALGAWGLLLAPVGGSAAVLAIGFAAAGQAARQRSREEAIDEMVAGLRSVLPRTLPADGAAEAAETSPGQADEAGHVASEPRRRAAG